MHFFTEEELLWTRVLVKNYVFLSSPDVNGVGGYCDVFISSRSDGTHSLHC